MKLKTIKCTCDGCPTQYEGTLKNGKSVYFRFRYGCGRIYIDDKIIHEFEYGDSMSGCISVDDVRNEFKKAKIKKFKSSLKYE